MSQGTTLTSLGSSAPEQRWFKTEDPWDSACKNKLVRGAQAKAPLPFWTVLVWEGLNFRPGSAAPMRKAERVTSEGKHSEKRYCFIFKCLCSCTCAVSEFPSTALWEACFLLLCIWGESLGANAGDQADKELSIIPRINELTHHCKHCAGGF